MMFVVRGMLMFMIVCQPMAIELCLWCQDSSNVECGFSDVPAACETAAACCCCCSSDDNECAQGEAPACPSDAPDENSCPMGCCLECTPLAPAVIPKVVSVSAPELMPCGWALDQALPAFRARCGGDDNPISFGLTSSLRQAILCVWLN